MMPVSTSMIVVDTNIVVYLLLPSEHSEIARQTFGKTPQWAAPQFWRSELRQVLTRYVKNRQISLESALEMQMAAEQLLGGREFAVDSAQVLAAATASGCSAYDCEFVVLAKSLGVPLVTNDHQVLRAFPDVAVSPATFVSA